MRLLELMNQFKLIQPFINIHGKSDIIKKLDLFNKKVSHKPVQNQNQAVQQPKHNITINATDKDYIQKKLDIKSKKIYSVIPNLTK